MKKGHEAKVRIKDMLIYHQNLPKKQLKAHSHPESHLFMPLKGDIWVNDIRVTPGKMYLLKGEEKHKFHSSDIQGERLIAMGKMKVRESGLYPANNLIKELLFHLLMDAENPSANTSLTLLKKLVMESSMLPAFDITQLHSKASDDRVLAAIRLMDKDLSLGMSAVAKEVGASTKTLTRLFSTELSLNPKQVQMALRIDKAKTLLKSKKMNVTEVAFEVGYNSLSAFIKVYRDMTGELPSG